MASCARMIPRYTLPEMAAIWSDARRMEMWKRVEVLALEAWAELGVVPTAAARAAAEAPTPSPEAVVEREAVTNHDLAAFVDVLAASMSDGGEWLHYGLTSSDVLDTANGALLRDAGELLVEALERLFNEVRSQAYRHRKTLMVGRTHGIWAEPTSFGLKLATWAFELARDHDRLRRATRSVSVGKISGAVGTYAHVPTSIEAYVCRHLGIGAEEASSQITHRDRHAEFLTVMALTGTSIERFATEIRHLQRSEVAEVSEAFRSGQKGSSAMPHKRNPIVSERMTGMARLLRGYALTAMENVALWHERDISHSSAERVIIPDSCAVLYYMLTKFTALVANLVVDEGRMMSNLESTRGLIYSQTVLLALVRTGMSRDEAYRITQRNALRAYEEGIGFRTALETDEAVNLDDIDGCFDPDRLLERASVVFERLESLELG